VSERALVLGEWGTVGSKSRQMDDGVRAWKDAADIDYNA
jgi:hypothetical protein